MTLVEIWGNAQKVIRSQVGDSSYETWLANLNPKEIAPSKLILETPDDFFKNWIIDHYLSIIQCAINQEAKTDVTIEFSVNSDDLLLVISWLC